jgi:16S rRNA (guanine527-N7)-methyltransferase
MSDAPTGTGADSTAESAESARPAAPPAAAAVFGGHLALAERFAAILADTGVSHGLVGPREVPRLWERHVLNCAVVQPAFPHGATLIDVGSGAGLPGLALAVVRPDLTVHLVEPMLRRTNWLADTVAQLGLANCEVHRGRAEEFHGVLRAPFATARAVARIDKLARWTFPLLADEGVLVALKGVQAEQELEAERSRLSRMGMVDGRIKTYGAGLLEIPTVTMELTVRQTERGPRGRRARGARGG